MILYEIPIVKDKFAIYGNKQVDMFLYNFFVGCSIIDDVIDRDLPYTYALEGSELMVKGMAVCPEGLKRTIMPLIEKIVACEKENMLYRPFSRSTEAEMDVWLRKSNFTQILFETLVYLDPSFETQNNRTWFNWFKKACYIDKDCANILKENCSDLVNYRRNYVALTIGQDIYFNWQYRQQELVDKAKEIYTANNLPPAPDERLNKIFFREAQ